MPKFKKDTISNRKPWWKITVFWFCIVVILFFLVSIAVAPLHKIREYENMAESDSLFVEKFYAVYNQPEISALVKEKAYKEALLKLSGQDSIQLAVNLADSTVNLFVKGVLIHQTKVKTYKKDKLFKIMPLIQQVKLLSQPLAVNHQYATIVKEPVVVHHAPKDEQEAALNAWQPDTLIQNPAFLILSAEHGINLIFEQDSNSSFHEKWVRFTFYNNLRMRNSSRALFNFIFFKKQEYNPAITIKMPVDDLRAVYRALPHNALVVIKI